MKNLIKALVVGIVLTLSYSAQARASYLVCESHNHDFKRCYSNEPISSARLHEQLSDSDCIHGQSWGYNNNSIWVDNGCRGRFLIESEPETVVRDVVCESNNDHDKRCYVDGIIRNVKLLEQYSHSDCNFGDSWAWDNDYLLVTNGCRGLFRINYRPY